MNEFLGKVAVITGGSSGIGKAIAGRCLDEGMQVVLAGINFDNLNAARKELSAHGGSVLPLQADVSRPGDIQRLAEKTVETFGGVHLLVNNAGVYAGTTIWESTPQDWQWVLDVNLWGTLNCLRTFVPIMLAQDCECHIVNVSSLAGLMVFPGWGPYKVTKASLIMIAETLDAELKARGANIGVSVLCPSFIQTNLMTAARPNFQMLPRMRRSNRESGKVSVEGCHPRRSWGLFLTAFAPVSFTFLPIRGRMKQSEAGLTLF